MTSTRSTNGDGHVDDIIIEALRSEFGGNALAVARSQLAQATDDARAGWEKIVERLCADERAVGRNA